MNKTSFVMSAPVLRSKKEQGKPFTASIQSILSRLQDPRDQNMHLIVSVLTLLFDAALSALIIARVPYTEIDWEAYMEEVEGFLGGELDYMKLKGGTGPLVYPAGFVYLFSAIRWITNGSVFPAQVLFVGVYLLTQAVVMLLYAKSEAMPPYLHIFLSLSKRLHSIYILRLFNDCWTMLIAYGAVYLLMNRRVAASIATFSFAVSTKMNVLLFAPGVLVACLMSARLQEVAVGVTSGIALQVALAAPFLAAAPASYLSRAFEFSRAFFYKWTVNWRMVPEDTFLSPQFAVVLFATHLALLATFAHFRWTAASGGVLQTLWRFLTCKSNRIFDKDEAAEAPATVSQQDGTTDIPEQHIAVKDTAAHRRPRTRSVTAKASIQKQYQSSRKDLEGTTGFTGQTSGGAEDQIVSEHAAAVDIGAVLSNGDVVEMVLCSNLIGIVCARSLHYQFYCWYFHSLPFLLWRTQLPLVVRVVLLVAIEWCWNVFPSTDASSSVLLASHVLCLCGLWFHRSFRIHTGPRAQCQSLGCI